jgi:hypothetical protein
MSFADAHSELCDDPEQQQVQGVAGDAGVSAALYDTGGRGAAVHPSEDAGINMCIPLLLDRAVSATRLVHVPTLHLQSWQTEKMDVFECRLCSIGLVRSRTWEGMRKCGYQLVQWG